MDQMETQWRRVLRQNREKLHQHQSQSNNIPRENLRHTHRQIQNTSNAQAPVTNSNAPEGTETDARPISTSSFLGSVDGDAHPHVAAAATDPHHAHQ